MNTNVLTATQEVANNVTEINLREVFTLEEHKQRGRKLARLRRNRDLNLRNVKSIKNSIKDCGVFQPIRIMFAKDIISIDEIIDFETGAKIPESEIENYDVIIDGQHRVQAYLELLKEEEKRKENEENKKKDGKEEIPFNKPLDLLYLVIDDETTLLKALTVINNKVSNWKGGDFSTAVQMRFKGEYELINEIENLTKAGYSLESANKWLTFENAITKTTLNNLASGAFINETLEEKLNLTSKIEIGKFLLESAKTRFPEKMLQSRVFIDWLIREFNKLTPKMAVYFEGDMDQFFEELTPYQEEQIKEVKGINTKEEYINKETALRNLLDMYYKEYTNRKAIEPKEETEPTIEESKEVA